MRALPAAMQARTHLRSALQRAAAVDRTVWMTSAGALLHIAIALFPWPNHPSASLSSISSSGELLLKEELYALDLFLRAATLAAGSLFLLVAWCGLKEARWPLRLAWLLPAAALAFPCWLAHYQPERMLERSFLYHEINRVAEDIDENLAVQQTDWRAWQTFDRETVANLPLLASEPSWLAGVLFRDESAPGDRAGARALARVPGFFSSQTVRHLGRWDNAAAVRFAPRKSRRIARPLARHGIGSGSRGSLDSAPAWPAPRRRTASDRG